jgi:cyanate permease
MFAGGLACGAFMGKVPPALPQMRMELGLSLVESGFIATMINLLGALAGMLMGMLGDRIGHKRLALAGLATLAAGGFVGAAAQGFPMLLLSRLLEGAGFIGFAVTGAALINASVASSSDRDRAMGLWTAYMPGGAALAMLAAPLVMATQPGWRGYWVLLSAVALACALLVWRVVPATRSARVGTLRLAIESLSQPGSVALALLFAFYVAQWTSVMIWLPTFVVERGGSAATAAFLGALMVLANVPGNLAAGWLLSHGVKRGTMVVAASTIAAACSAGMLGEWLPDGVRFALVLAFSCIAGAIPAAILSGVAVHARSPGHIGTTNGMVMQLAQIGQSVGPIVLAWIASHFGGWGATLWGMLAFAAACALCGIAVGRIEHGGEMRR